MTNNDFVHKDLVQRYLTSLLTTGDGYVGQYEVGSLFFERQSSGLPLVPSPIQTASPCSALVPFSSLF